MENYHNNIIELFNAYREFLFEQNTLISGISSYDYLIDKEKLFYSSNTENQNYITIIRSSINRLHQNYVQLQNRGFCSWFFSFFNSEEECLNYIGGENGIISLGFQLFVDSFIEEIRNARNYMKLLIDQEVLVGNLSKFIFSYYNDSTYSLDKNDTLIFRMKVFNMEQTHYRLNIIFQNIILQYINEERNLTLNSIENSVEKGHIQFIILITIYSIIVLVYFLFYWIPMIKVLNTEIYKTKKMLSIIPVQILVSQPNIKELLNISTNNN